MTAIGRTIEALRNRIGPLGIGVIMVFVIMRFGDVANLVCRVYLGNVLDPVDFGAIDPVMAALAVFTVPVMICFQIVVKSISRLRAMKEDGKCNALILDTAGMTLIAGIVAAMAVWLGGDFILSRLRLEDGIYVWIIAAIVVVMLWQYMCAGVLQGDLHYRLMVGNAFSTSAIILLSTFIIVGIYPFGLKGALLAKALSGVATVVVLYLLLKPVFAGRREPYADEIRLMKEMLLPMTVYVLTTTLLFNADRLFVRNFIINDSGGYGAVITLGTLPFHTIASIVFVVFPMAAAGHASNRDLRGFYRQSVGLGVLITACYVIAAVVFAAPLMRLWNEEFVPYAGYVWLYALAMGLHGMVQIVASVEMARHSYRFLWFAVIPALVMCGALYWQRSVLTVATVITVLIVTHVVILVGIWLNRILAGDAQRTAASKCGDQ